MSFCARTSTRGFLLLKMEDLEEDLVVRGRAGVDLVVESWDRARASSVERDWMEVEESVMGLDLGRGVP